MEIPDALRDLELYAVDPKLCAAWSTWYPAACAAYPDLDVLAEVGKAHLWELSQAPAQRKKSRTRFLRAWLARGAKTSGKDTEYGFV